MLTSRSMCLLFRWPGNKAFKHRGEAEVRSQKTTNVMNNFTVPFVDLKCALILKTRNATMVGDGMGLKVVNAACSSSLSPAHPHRISGIKTDHVAFSKFVLNECYHRKAVSIFRVQATQEREMIPCGHRK